MAVFEGLRGEARLERDRERARLAMAVAAFALGVPPHDMQVRERGGTAGFARQVAMYLTHVVFEMSLARVAVAFGRDRSTVGYACHQMEDRREEPAFDEWIEALETTMRTAPSPQRERA